MEYLFLFLMTFVIVFIVYLIIYFIRRKRNTLKKLIGFDLLEGKYKIKNINYNKTGLLLILINTFIISVSGVLCTMVNLENIWQILIGFCLLMANIIIFYSLLGKYLKKKEGKKNEYTRNRKKMAK